MPTDAEIKKEFRKKANKDYQKTYPIKTLQELGYKRNKCSKCNRYFWSQQETDICGDPQCAGKLTFIGKSPCKTEIKYLDVWKKYAKIHEKIGYTPINRYPVIARWNPTTEFTIASIAAFQPYVVSGEIKPPANPLVIPQFCLRFNDTDNVGITGHNVGFIMLGEHAFVKPKDYNINKYLQDHLTWLKDGMKLPLKEIKIHEDVWAGGGNFGPCVEFFSRGLEVSNQVYMQYEVTQKGYQELNQKVLDMGQGYGRVAWLTQGALNNYETMFPAVIKKLRERTNVILEKGFAKKFYPLSPRLNIDEVQDLEKSWKEIAKELGMTLKEVKEKATKQAELYSAAEHVRALLVAINDGGLPSNVGGMYNLRVILRRALHFIDKNEWDLNLGEISEWHAKELKPLFPELQENLDNVKQILHVEKKKYLATREKIKQILGRIVTEKINKEKLIELYDSHGISPEDVAEEAKKQGKKITLPKNFYALVSERHEKTIHEAQTFREEEKLPKAADTEALYFDDYTKNSFTAEVLAIIDKKVILDKTLFYPTSGGQLHDKGELNGNKVIDVYKQGGIIIHVLEKKPNFVQGSIVKGELDFDRRVQLAQHHTAAHIINAAARIVLGHHVNQAGAKKDLEKGQLDITHYETLTDKQVKKIEEEANKIVKKGIDVKSEFIPREQAEKKYGMRIYQGGAVPGKKLRIVSIGTLDIEACGGTHLNNTLEAGEIVIIKTTKIKDGVIRIIFAAGRAAENLEEKDQHILEKVSAVLNVDIPEIPSRAQELFEKWKKARKAIKKKKEIQISELELVKKEKTKGKTSEILVKTAEVLQTQPEYLLNTLTKFMKELEEMKEKLK